MNNKNNELRNKAENAKMLYKYAKITRAEAEKDIKPYLELVNDKATELAKEYGVTAKKVSMIGYLR